MNRLSKPGYKIIAVIAVMLYVGHVEQKAREQENAINALEQDKKVVWLKEQAKQKAYEDFLRKHHHPSPKVASKAVIKGAKKEKVMLAVVAQEGASPSMKSRDGHGSIGLGQVTPKWHGKVPSDPVSQIMQSERLLDEMTGDNSLASGLERYNGSKRYARSVISKLEELNGLP